ncbi:MAG: putative sliding-clamp-loader subunit [Prokaryotic dsDNA virus sp.]|nr:MAG: putative sliding-clamp-loader subunit [Prokaryotic dsDNA virus sp.]|tara:strand:- start:6114 stop:7076 length:963 start_codon:yes stop_codon:yes gene_type:complete
MSEKKKELYKKHRPSKFKDVLGQEASLSVLRGMVKRKQVPHAMLFTGPSGCGKTTVARILAKYIKCSEHDLEEKNSADFRGVDTVRELRRNVMLSPMHGEVRVWIIDECHRMTRDAQEAILKLLEDGPDHAYFFLCTTEPQALIKAIHTRCTQVHLKGLDKAAVADAVQHVIDSEGLTVPEGVMDAIIDDSDGSARKALVLLEQVAFLGGEQEQLAGLRSTSLNNNAAIELCRMLSDAKPPSWREVSALLKKLEEEPETMRRMLLGYFTSVLLNTPSLGPRANMFAGLIEIFEDSYFQSGRPGLVKDCYEAVDMRNTRRK